MTVSNWYHSRPKNYYKSCIKMFGKPTFVANVRHGYALWKTKGLFTHHLLIDEDVKHCVPRIHHDYFYSSVKFFVPKDKLCDVLKISGSINYDGLKKELTARCGGIGANYATLYLGMLVASGKLSLAQVKKDDMYPKMIRGEIIPHDKLKKIMYKLKVKNNKRYKKQLAAEFADYAYNKCYQDKKSKTRKKKTKTRTKKMTGGTRRRKTLRNMKNKSCKSKHFTACCPHMAPDDKGRYAATGTKHVLKYKGKNYRLMTCCKMCGDSMNDIAKRNPSKFAKLYINSIDAKGNIHAKNRHTGKIVQIMRLIK